MKRKVLAGILMLALTAGMLAGCGKKEVDYSLEEDGTESDAKENSATIENHLAQFKTVETWTENWTITDGDGQERPVEIDAEVIMPDMEKLSVVEVERQPLDTSFRKQFLRAYFENGEIYEHDIAQYTKAELEDIIVTLEEQMDELDAQMQEQWQQFIEEYEEQLETAPDEYVATENYASNDYVGSIGEHAGNVSIEEKYESIYAWSDIEPEELSDYRTVMQLSAEEKGDTAGMENGCQLTLTEAKSLADAFLIKIGRGGQVCMEAEDLMWQGENRDGNGKITEYERILYGYVFTYGTGVDNMAFCQSPNFDFMDLDWPDGDKIAPYNNGDRIRIVVTDDGVVEVDLIDPVNIRKVSEVANIISIDTVKDIIKNEITENAQAHNLLEAGGENQITFNRLQLIYMKLLDETQEGVYSYVPVWCASKYLNYSGLGYYSNPIFVNAVDGSIIYLDDFYAGADEGGESEEDVTIEDTEAM